MQRAASLSLALLFLASIFNANAQTTDAAPPAAEAGPGAGAGPGRGVGVVEGDGALLVVYEVRGNLSLDCRGLSADDGLQRDWLVNDTALEALPEGARARLKLSAARDVLSVDGRAVEDDFGNYSCVAGAARRDWRVRGRVHGKMPANANVVEGQKLKLTCKLIGKPYTAVEWRYSNTSDQYNDSLPVLTALGLRASLRDNEQGVPGAELVVDPAQREDAGWYHCAPLLPAGEHWEPVRALSTLRVKDMYAALWPFLGICAEVFVLCAIILVYEKRRTKPELDDSDTDNHDQKKS